MANQLSSLKRFYRKHASITLLWLLTAILPFTAACSAENNKFDPQANHHAAPQSFDIPSSRTFSMGMTPWPYDITPKAVIDTYKTLDKHTDIVAHHFDEGVPWDDSLQNRKFHKKVMENINYRLSQLPGKKVYLAVTPIHAGRNAVAGNWGESTNEKLKGKWRGKAFDDPEIIASYLSFCRYMIKSFKPSYFNYAIEANILLERNPKLFPSFLRMSEKVYKTLKSEFPELPVFASIHIDTFQKDRKKQSKNIKKLFEFSDYITVSSYPYCAANLSGESQTHYDPKTIPSNWFTQIKELAPRKDFAIAETGFQAQDFRSRKYGIHIKGDSQLQENYLNWLMHQANATNSKFVIWFVARDYDQFWKVLERMGIDDAFKTWKDTGLIDENGTPRPAMTLWNKWLKLKKH